MDQWLLLATMYGFIVIPQLWSKCLPTDLDDHILQQRAAVIKRAEADKEANTAQKAHDKQTLAEVKKKAKKQAEKIRQSMEEKLRAAEHRVKFNFTIIKLTDSHIPKAGKHKAVAQTVLEVSHSGIYCCLLLFTKTST
ncbi:hypothetical protein EDB19DRAFT_1833257 [Suillus lakei]|nr:hypothetical protein EDB19DRAFT_1833257 [Suillus lakei]